MAKKLLHAPAISVEADVADKVSELLVEQGKPTDVLCAELLTLEVRVREESGGKAGLAELVAQAKSRKDFWSAHVEALVYDESEDDVENRAARTNRL